MLPLLLLQVVVCVCICVPGCACMFSSVLDGYQRNCLTLIDPQIVFQDFGYMKVFIMLMRQSTSLGWHNWTVQIRYIIHSLCGFTISDHHKKQTNDIFCLFICLLFKLMDCCEPIMLKFISVDK